jgi:putative CocE/NonD family hydrolase
LYAALFGVVLGLAACGSSSAVDPQGGTTAAESGWTTLGTREGPSQPSVPVTGNAGAKWVDYNPPAIYPGVVSSDNQFIPMSDGTLLAANVTLPADAGGNAVSAKLPAILVQTGYNKDIGVVGGSDDPYIGEHGYVQVVVDTRGTGRSEGEWQSFGALEQSDYLTVMKWVISQPWSNGQVGLEGASLLAITALLTAEEQPPGLKAVFAVVPMGDSYRDIVFQGGELNVGFIPLWLGLVTGLGLVDTTFSDDPTEALTAIADHIEGAVTDFQVPQVFNSVIGNPETVYDGPFWQIRSPLDKAPQIQVPTFVIGGLHCIFQRGEPLIYETLKHNVSSKLLIGPWNHVQASEGEGLPEDGVPVYDHIELQWFDQYIKGMDVGADKQPNVTQYVYGYDHYVTYTDWPNPAASAQRLYLHGDNSLSDTAPAPGEASHDVIQEPLNGLCSASTAQWTAGLLGALATDIPCFTDDNLTETLESTYDTAPMTQDYYINGPIEADVWVSTTNNDAPVVVRVDDVDGSGNAFALTNGIMQASLRAVDTTKARYLDGQMIQPWHDFTQTSVEPVGANNAVEVPVEIFPTAALIQQGHKLRISVGASDFPHGLPPLPDLLNQTVGLLTIYSDATHPSSVVLPVVPAATLSSQ